MPPWAGWVSLTGDKNDENSVLSTIDYMASVFYPITDNVTVQHILKLSQDASTLVGQQYSIVTFDLAVAKKAYTIVGQKPDEFKNTIVRMGGFHLTCTYMGALGKMMRCSGLEEILIESGICASGSIEKVMTGKHYNRALRIHKIVLEALERLLMQVFEQTTDENLNDEARYILLRLAEDPCQEKI